MKDIEVNIIALYILGMCILCLFISNIYPQSNRKAVSVVFFWPVWALMWVAIGLSHLVVGAKEVFFDIVKKEK